nr:regulatory protein swi6 [Quercus suber]POE94707.1 regulatory protein swi6 [Quercus suber]
MLEQNLAAHKELLRARTEQIDKMNEQIRDVSALQTADLERLTEMKERVKLRAERQAKVANLKRAILERKEAKSRQQSQKNGSTTTAIGQPEWLNESNQEMLLFDAPNATPNNVQRQFLSSKVPHPRVIRAHLNAVRANNATMRQRTDELKARSSELEDMYRKVISLCTGVPEDKAEESLPALVAAVESERGGLGEQELFSHWSFLRRMVFVANMQISMRQSCKDGRLIPSQRDNPEDPSKFTVASTNPSASEFLLHR